MQARQQASVAARRDELLGQSREQLSSLLASYIDAPYRIDQIYDHLYRQGVASFDEMSSLPTGLRSVLAEHFDLGRLPVKARHRSRDETVKLLFELHDGATIETVDIPDRGRRTLCLSSQAGCALACQFCVTGYWGAGRDLTVGEIVGQVLGACGHLPYDESVNLVFMGMGEPLLNLEAVKQALDLLSDAISWRRITVSTVGILPALTQMTRWSKRPNLAISLHAADDRQRSRLMPINRRYPLDDLMAALAEYPLERGRRITFEYVLIDGINDTPDDARKLARLVRSLPSKVNLIPINPDPVLGSAMVPPPDPVVDEFRGVLDAAGTLVTVRRRRGDDVSAACGQLRAQHREPRGFARSDLSW